MAMDRTATSVSLFDTIILLVTILALIGGAITIFGNDSLAGATQVAMILCAFTGIMIGLKNGHRWQALENQIVQQISRTVGALLIFLSIGSLIGSFMLSGAVPTLLYVGLNILSPSYFYPLACLICAVVSICIGSSWTTAATVGIGMIGVAYGFQLSPEITAGAVISGAYFGDKLSPLSETTNLAPAISGSDLFQHIRHMSWATIPSFVLALLLFTIVGLMAAPVDNAQPHLLAILATLEQTFNIAWYNLIPIVLLLAMSVLKVPAFLAIMMGSLVACVFAVLFQLEVLLAFVGESNASLFAIAKAIWLALYSGFDINSGNNAVDDLLSRGGMSSMVVMAWLVICSMTMTGVLEKIGFIDRLLQSLMRFIVSSRSLIATTMATSIGVNVLTGDQYLSIILPGQMWRSQYQQRRLATKNLSRALEDAGTITSPLIPWNGCGVYMAGALGVATLDYLPYTFFNLLSPIISLLLVMLGMTIAQQTAPYEDEIAQVHAK